MNVQTKQFYAPLTSDNPNRAAKLNVNQVATYPIPHPVGWGGRFWPKVGCDDNGANCTVGSSKDGCIREAGAIAINRHGQLAGFVSTATASRAVVWRPGIATPLPPLSPVRPAASPWRSTPRA